MASTDLPLLRECLEATTWRRLLAIADSHGLPASTRWRKQQLIDTLQAHLLDASVLHQVVLSLPEPAHVALSALLLAEGTLPAGTFSARFGQIRPFRPWREDSGEAKPWRTPASPAERLWYLGLIHLHPRRPSPGESQQATLAQELLDVLASIMITAPTNQPVRLHARPSASPDLLWDMALLLGTVEEEPIRPRHGRWLPPRILKTLASRMGQDHLPDFQPSLSERANPYLAFVHYLAQSAGLLSGTTRLGLTSSAWQWLASDAPARWQMLWQGWGSAPANLAAPFQFPWAALSPEARKLIFSEIRKMAWDRFAALCQIVAQARLHDERGQLAQPWNIEEEITSTLITGPLLWLGIVDLGGKRESDSAPSSAAAADSEEEDAEGTAVQVPDLLVRLTALGAWLLELPDFGAPSFTNPEPCSIRPPNYDQILVPPSTAPLHLARLAPLCHWSPPEPPALEQRLLLAPERIGQTAAQGTELEQILQTIEDALGRPPSRRQQRRIRRWADAGRQVRVRHVTLLESADPQLMGALRSRKLIRRHLGDALSPTRSELNPAGMPALLKTLRALDLYASVPAEIAPSALQAGGEESGTQPSDAVALSAADASLLLAAAHVYEGLGAYAKLPLSVTAQTIQALTEQLAPAQQEAAEQAAREVIKQIEAALQGYLALPAWHLQRNTERTASVIESAIAKQQELVLSYQGAIREQLTVRRVTPYWLEKRYKVLYLIAYCRLREEERVFRVDRIIKCQKVE